jgi:Flp pilus assembly protein TadB
LECFLAGVAVAVLGSAAFVFFLQRSVAKHREALPSSLHDAEDGLTSHDQLATALRERLQAIEKRLAELEEQAHRQGMARPVANSESSRYARIVRD